MEYRADLHCHSSCSDGTLTPIALIHLAKEKGLSALSITDHDSFRAYSEESFAEAKRCQLDLLIGVEFTAAYLGTTVHVLGYAIELTPEILSFCDSHQERRKKRNCAILKKLASHGILIEEKELYEGNENATVGRVHIAELMVKKGVVKNMLEAFHKFIGDGKSCFDPGEGIHILETIAVIHRAGGKAFIAHPHLFRKRALLEALLEMGFDGIECYYASFPPKDQEKWVKLAQEKKLLISGGSDFHGGEKSHAPLGASYVDRSTMEKIFFL